MSDFWFVEERRNDTWEPAVYRGKRPTGKRLDAPDRIFRNPPVLIDKHDHHIPLSQLKAKYGTKETA